MIAAPAIRPPVLPWEVAFGRASAAFDAAGLSLPLPLLSGGPERIFGAVGSQAEKDGFRMVTTEDLLLGCAIQPLGSDVMASSRDLYRRLLRAAAGRFLYRIWNYLPGINEMEEGMENYRAFSAGRSLAFEEACGPHFPFVLPAASAVGCGGTALATVFVAGRVPPRHIENPEQVPAYRYPLEHGPRSPSFSRATTATDGRHPLLFISGTAAIKGHGTVAPERLDAQLDCTLDNLRLVSESAGMGADLGAGRKFARHFKVYLRHAADFAAAKKRLEGALFRPADRVIWLQADLCRRALLVEVEATLIGE
jgi:chorismate lyase / 3-hydroxybenzoate synthase